MNPSFSRFVPRFARSAAPRAAGSESQPIAEIIRENVFTPYRERILYPVAAVGIAILLPFGAYHVAMGHALLGTLLLVTVALLALDTIAVHRGRAPPVPFAFLLLPAAASVAVLMTIQGLHGALWTFPLVMFGYFVLPRRKANIAGAAMLLVSSALLLAYDGAGTALRLLLSLGLCMLAVNINLSVLDSAHARLAGRSLNDPLTGAFNRRHMDTCLEHVIERLRRSGATASVLLVDLDRFRIVNDRFGPDAGDAALRAVADRLRAASRKVDLVFRVAGDKFLLLLPDTSAGEAQVLAENIRAAASRTPIVANFTLTASIGVAEVHRDDDGEGLLARARQALIAAKDEGRDRVRA
jgi:diguanylate cyclase (GGDEF)-like protein